MIYWVIAGKFIIGIDFGMAIRKFTSKATIIIIIDIVAIDNFILKRSNLVNHIEAIDISHKRYYFSRIN